MEITLESNVNQVNEDLLQEIFQAQELAKRAREMSQDNGGKDIMEDEEEYYAAGGSAAGGMDIGRGSQYDPPNPRPHFERDRRGPQRRGTFDFRRPREQNSDQKLDAILSQMKSLATKQDVGMLHRKVNAVEENHAKLVKKVDRLAEQVAAGATANATPQPSSSNELSDRREFAFLEARKSLILGPVGASEAEIRTFMVSKMKMDPVLAGDLVIVEIKKIHDRLVNPRRKQPGQVRRNKVRVTFDEVQEKEVVLSHAHLLGGDAHLETHVPEFLEPLKRHLDSYAFRIRKNARDQNKDKVSTQVRLDDREISLLLAGKENEEDGWVTYTREQLREIDEKKEIENQKK